MADCFRLATDAPGVVFGRRHVGRRDRTCWPAASAPRSDVRGPPGPLPGGLTQHRIARPATGACPFAKPTPTLPSGGRKDRPMADIRLNTTPRSVACQLGLQARCSVQGSVWRERRESNPRPTGYEPVALPIELLNRPAFRSCCPERRDESVQSLARRRQRRLAGLSPISLPRPAFSARGIIALWTTINDRGHICLLKTKRPRRLKAPGPRVLNETARHPGGGSSMNRQPLFAVAMAASVPAHNAPQTAGRRRVRSKCVEFINISSSAYPHLGDEGRAFITIAACVSRKI